MAKKRDNNIIDFEKKSNEILFKKITDYSDIAQLIIDGCYNDGEFDCELAKQLLFETRVVDEHEELRNTMLSMTIEAIEEQGFVDEANELREMLSAHLDKDYEGAIKMAKQKGLGDGIEIYNDSEAFLDNMPKEERDRIEAVVKKLFADEIDFSKMSKEEVYEILKDDAKFCFYYGFAFMKSLVLDNKRNKIDLTFDEWIPMMGVSKDAFSYLANVFQEVSFSHNAKSKTVTAHFSFHNLKVSEN